MSPLYRLVAACAPLALLGTLAGPAHAGTADTTADTGYERILNGTFDTAKAPWWSSANTPSAVENGQLCAHIPAGTDNPWQSMIGENDIPLEKDQPYTLRFTATATRTATVHAALALSDPPATVSFSKALTITTQPQTFEVSGVSKAASTHGQVSFQTGGAAEAYTLCLDGASLTGGANAPGQGWDYGSAVRVDQVGYLASGSKRASIAEDSTEPQPWQLRDAQGQVVAQGRTRVQGADAMSGDHVHLVDFSGFRGIGSGYTLTVGTETSLPFAISKEPYGQLRDDALRFFYLSRSGIALDSEHAGAAYARPAGHVGTAPNQGDTQVPCLPGECDYSLDVQGGWYDAGDQGKYVVNGAFAAWQLMDLYERARGQGDRAALADAQLNIPESGNRIPDVLDEARWEMEFLLRMQVPQGQRLAGMAHHKIHDLAWTPLPTAPQNDAQPRYLHPPTTAATLNLAAAAAQCARLFAPYDRAFATRCRTAAETAWQAAEAHPDRYASPTDSVGGGAYDDTDVSDEFSWAAAELYATTGRAAYLKDVDTEITADGFSWRDTGALADLTTVRLPDRFPHRRVQAARKRLLAVADTYLRNEAEQGYPNPVLPAGGTYVWGSNSATANAAVILATAYDTSHNSRYRQGALDAMDYLLGRNALNQSFVTGYGAKDSHNQHHRSWAHQLNANLPAPPPGSLAGGPYSGIEDPVAQQNLRGCAPAKCYIDDIDSYSTNEVAINWNSALAWVSAFADSR